MAGVGKGGGGGDFGNVDFGPILQFAQQQGLTKVRDRYANLGLGGSTMEAMDEAGVGLGTAAEGAQLAMQQQGQQISNLTQLANLFGSGAGSTGFSQGAGLSGG